MTRLIIGMFLALHGLVHLIGFTAAFHLRPARALPESSLLWGTIAIGSTTAHVLGIVWLLATFAFLSAALGVWLAAPWATAAMAGAALLSGVMCLMASPAAIAGLVIDVILLVAVIAVPEWLAGR